MYDTKERGFQKKRMPLWVLPDQHAYEHKRYIFLRAIEYILLSYFLPTDSKVQKQVPSIGKNKTRPMIYHNC